MTGSNDRHTILHDLHDQHEWACAYAAAETFRAFDGLGRYGPAQGKVYHYEGKGGTWTLAAWRDSEGIHVARVSNQEAIEWEAAE